MAQRTICGLLIVLLLILIGCGKTEKEGDRTLRIGGLGGKPGPINQIISNQTVSMAIAELVFNRLVRINSRMLPEPDLAERWQVSPDGLAYTFYLRKGVRFHDGTELTAKDCEFTYNAVLNPATKSPWRDNYSMIKTVSAENNYTFRVTLREPQASFINLMNFPIHPAHTSDIHHPIGAGPFRFVERTADDRIILERNEDYYERSTLINRIEARGYDSFAEYFSAFMKEEIDFAFFLNPEQFETAGRDPGLRAVVIPSAHTYAIDYNPEHPLFKRRNVRKAIALVLNIPEIMNKVEGGLGIQSTGPFLPGAWFSDPEVKPLEYNPALALRILKEAGWTTRYDVIASPQGVAILSGLLRRPDGTPRNDNVSDDRVLEKDGVQFRFTLLVDPRERTTEMLAKIIYQELYKIGIRIDIRPFDSDKAGEPENQELLNQAGAFITSFKITSELEPQWHSDKQHRSNKWWKYVDSEIDRLFEKANTTYDIGKRQTIYHRLHRMLYEAQPATFLYFLPNLAAVDKRFGNTDELFSPAMPFYTIKDWEILTKE